MRFPKFFPLVRSFPHPRVRHLNPGPAESRLVLNPVPPVRPPFPETSFNPAVQLFRDFKARSGLLEVFTFSLPAKPTANRRRSPPFFSCFCPWFPAVPQGRLSPWTFSRTPLTFLVQFIGLSKFDCRIPVSGTHFRSADLFLENDPRCYPAVDLVLNCGCRRFLPFLGGFFPRKGDPESCNSPQWSPVCNWLGELLNLTMWVLSTGYVRPEGKRIRIVTTLHLSFSPPSLLGVPKDFPTPLDEQGKLVCLVFPFPPFFIWTLKKFPPGPSGDVPLCR